MDLISNINHHQNQGLTMTNLPEDRTGEEIRDAIKIDGEAVRGHLDELVRSTVEETLNKMLDAEADQICNAKRYERTADRVDSRAGSYSRKLQTKAGEVSLKVPRLRSLPLETQIIERYKRRESSVEEALVEMYLAGVSVRRVEDITEALWGTRVSSSTWNAPIFWSTRYESSGWVKGIAVDCWSAGAAGTEAGHCDAKSAGVWPPRLL
ncbi:putative transposase [Blastopirellula marina DSM 3645]|uniref:Mutator family transposase n=1 Tax=Blastopirellula marina DSM 3645 TaxID=314230 RepID=A3ZSD7_9BACT|nr:putative transposase [Blastopirellula marina DSM 3645]